jgi:hypothetical protein
MRGSTLEELEGVRWGEPEFESHLVVTCHRLRKKPVDAFSIEDLRIIIGQNIGLPHLLPCAATVLEANPLAQGDFYPGDLLSAVLHADQSVLRQRPELMRRIIAIIDHAVKLLTAEGDPQPRSTEAKFLREIIRFRADAAAK